MPGAINNGNMPPQSGATNFDVVFLHDATGSQQPYIDAARQFSTNFLDIIDDAAFKRGGGTARYRVVTFRDHREQGDAWVVEAKNPFTRDHNVLREQLNKIVASGGGDGPEAQIDALDEVTRSDFRNGVKKIVVLITDSPPHGIPGGDPFPKSHPPALTANAILTTYKRTGIALTVVGCIPTINSYKGAVAYYKDFASQTKGKYFELPGVSRDPTIMKRAVAGAVLHAMDNHRVGDRWDKWIRSESQHGHAAIASAMHSKLSAEGEHCHEVGCVHGTDVRYDLAPISRARVDYMVGQALSDVEEASKFDSMFDF